MTQPLSIVVVGGGAFGASAAVTLNRRGHQVTLIDQGPLPHMDASSTDVSKVVRMDYGGDEFYLRLAAEALNRWDQMNESLPSPLYHQSGFLLLARSVMESGSFEYEGFNLIPKNGFPLERMDPGEVRRRFPAWMADNYPDGYFNARAGWAESGATVAALLSQARTAGVKIREHDGFGRLLGTGSKVTGVETASGDVLTADRVIVAAGAWTPVLLPWLSDRMWTNGQPVMFFQVPDVERYQPPYFPTWAADLSRTGWYGFPALADGRLKVGHHGKGLRIDPRGEKVVPAGHEERTREFLSETFPELAAAPVMGNRLCLYCDTFDSDFWIDEDPDREGLIVAAGGSGHGFKFTPVLGDIIADKVERKENPWAHRFRWRTREPGNDRFEDARFVEK